MLALLLFVSPQVVYSSKLENLADLWKTLLHVGSEVTDNSFYLLGDHDSSSQLSLFINESNGLNRARTICRFPARYLLLERFKKVKPFDLSRCNELSDFIRRAPASEISYVFASESIAKPASIMGHSVLKISHGNTAHSISFFTRLDDVNPIGLIWQSFITGKEGIYALAPYSETKNYYLRQEKRSLWEYKIDLTDFEVKLIHYHLYELKHIKFRYFFHRFNCATLLRDILSIGVPSLKKSGHLWVTPQDIVRSLAAKGSIAARSFIGSPEWKIKSINRNYRSSEMITNLKSNTLVSKNFPPTAQGYANFELSLAYFESRKKEPPKVLLSHAHQYESFDFSLSSKSSPEFSQGDSQIGYAIGQAFKSSFHSLRFLALSRRLRNSLVGLDAETETKMGEVELRLRNKRLVLQKFEVLGFKVLRPHDSLLGGWSGEFSTGFRRFIDENISENKSLYLRAGVGKTYRFVSSIDTFLLGSGELNKKFSYSLSPGIIIREKLGLKTIGKYIFSNFFNQQRRSEFQVIQALNLKSYTFSIEFRRIQIEEKSENQLVGGIDFLF